jgi:hypothetical protein
MFDVEGVWAWGSHHIVDNVSYKQNCKLTTN